MRTVEQNFNLAANLKYLRKKNGLTQSAFSKLMGIPKSQIVRCGRQSSIYTGPQTTLFSFSLFRESYPFYYEQYIIRRMFI